MNLQWNYRGKGLTQKMQQIQTHHATFFPSLSHPLPPISQSPSTRGLSGAERPGLVAGEGTLARLREAGCAAGCPIDLLCQSLDLRGSAWEMKRGSRGRLSGPRRLSPEVL